MDTRGIHSISGSPVLGDGDDIETLVYETDDDDDDADDIQDSWSQPPAAADDGDDIQDTWSQPLGADTDPGVPPSPTAADGGISDAQLESVALLEFADGCYRHGTGRLQQIHTYITSEVGAGRFPPRLAAWWRAICAVAVAYYGDQSQYFYVAQPFELADLLDHYPCWGAAKNDEAIATLAAIRAALANRPPGTPVHFVPDMPPHLTPTRVIDALFDAAIVTMVACYAPVRGKFAEWHMENQFTIALDVAPA